jgi:formate transporter
VSATAIFEAMMPSESPPSRAPDLFGLDAFSPNEVAKRVETVGVAKAHIPLLSQAMLGILAGAFIGIGALCATMVFSDDSIGFSSSRILGGLVFSLGLVLVSVAGAELFTGNNLLAMAWADGHLSTASVLRNWAIVCLANLVGAVGLAVLVVYSGHLAMNDGAVGATAVKIAAAKCKLPFEAAFIRGVLCNVLVCMAVWMAFAGRSVVDKVFAIVPPITAFVAAGFEHSIANMYFIPLGWLAVARDPALAAIPGADAITLGNFGKNLAPVILGNLVGGSILVALVYWIIYLRPATAGALGVSARSKAVSAPVTNPLDERQNAV